MKRSMTLQQYRNLDLFVFTAMLSVFEFLILRAAVLWFPGQPYTVSAAAAVACIVLMRWGAFALIPAAVGGFVFCFFSGAAPVQYLIYCAGNLFAVLSLLPLRLIGEERIRSDALLSITFALFTQLSMQAGRALIGLLFAPPAVCLRFFTTDALSGLFTMVLIWIARRQDGLFENQKSYILRIREERSSEEGGHG